MSTSPHGQPDSPLGQPDSPLGQPDSPLGQADSPLGQPDSTLGVPGALTRRPGPPPAWPELSFGAWQPTCETLHMWLQIVGKIRLSYCPWVNHQWHGTLYVTARGLTTLPIPFQAQSNAPTQSFQLDFDFLDHVLRMSTSGGDRAEVALRPRSVADFHRAVLGELAALGLPVEIHGSPNEVPDPVPFAENEAPGAYDPEYATRFFRVLSSTARAFGDFRSRFTGKSSPVHFFWGAMDLAVTRFSGREAPEHPGGIPNLPDWITREAYSHEVFSVGFWPGSAAFPSPIFYAYAYPNPDGLQGRGVEPAAARWEKDLSEFVLPYEALRTSEDPDGDLMAFLESTWEAAAELGEWDRSRLEWAPGEQPLSPGL
ncbi:DUF5996 family protein [soil metagenome]